MAEAESDDLVARATREAQNWEREPQGMEATRAPQYIIRELISRVEALTRQIDKDDLYNVCIAEISYAIPQAVFDALFRTAAQRDALVRATKPFERWLDSWFEMGDTRPLAPEEPEGDACPSVGDLRRLTAAAYDAQSLK